MQNQKFVAERLTEAFRVSLLVAQRSNLTLPVFPYLRPLYLTKSRDFKMLNEVRISTVYLHLRKKSQKDINFMTTCR